MPKLANLLTALADIAPLHLAEPWDNVGLLAGDPDQPLTRALLTIDMTATVVAEACARNCQAIVAYHPPIFRPLKRIDSASPLALAIRSDLAIYSPHTALDAAEGGTNDVLADAIAMTSRAPLRPARIATGPSSASFKLVTFVPESAVESLSRALFDAGAGRIGEYSSCSFRTSGTGTFFGSDATHPATGQTGRLEHVAEIRLETVVPAGRIADVVAALRAVHPYEEPAFDLVVLAAAPPDGSPSAIARLGPGRVGEIPAQPMTSLLGRIGQFAKASHLLTVGSTGDEVTRVAICAGAGGELLDDAIAAKAQVFITGELRHHDALKAAAAGIVVVCTLHSNSERPVLRSLAARIHEIAPDIEAVISLEDAEPFAIR